MKKLENTASAKAGCEESAETTFLVTVKRYLLNFPLFLRPRFHLFSGRMKTSWVPWSFLTMWSSWPHLEPTPSYAHQGFLCLVYPEALFPWLHGQSRPILWRQSSCTQDPTGVGWGIPTRGIKWESLFGFSKARQGAYPRIYKLLFWEINYKMNCLPPKNCTDLSLYNVLFLKTSQNHSNPMILH